MMERDLLFSPEKLGYVQGSKRPKVDCIFCAARDGVPGVDNLIVYCARYFFVTLNLYPYNPGHLMIVPLKHTETVEDFNPDEVQEWYLLQKLCIAVLRKMYEPLGFNMGYNMGKCSGASIDHLHFHIVPRYRSELGFMDILNGTRIIVEAPQITKTRMRGYFEDTAQEMGLINKNEENDEQES
jgi:ATP adenylyltransferase